MILQLTQVRVFGVVMSYSLQSTKLQIFLIKLNMWNRINVSKDVGRIDIPNNIEPRNILFVCVVN